MRVREAGELKNTPPNNNKSPPKGHGLPLRHGVFDGAISISAVQWLCNADSSAHDPRRRMRAFFSTLYACLTRGARAVLQVLFVCLCGAFSLLFWL